MVSERREREKVRVVGERRNRKISERESEGQNG